MKEYKEIQKSQKPRNDSIFTVSISTLFIIYKIIGDVNRLLTNTHIAMLS